MPESFAESGLRRLDQNVDGRVSEFGEGTGAGPREYQVEEVAPQLGREGAPQQMNELLIFFGFKKDHSPLIWSSVFNEFISIILKKVVMNQSLYLLN